MAALHELPNEILSLITSHLERPRDVLHLALASRRLSEFAALDGWKALLKGRFHITGLESDARNSLHGITTLYRNWNRKGFVARYLEPTVCTTNLDTWKTTKWRGPRGQTMGYSPSIDSYEELYGAWTERKEVLAWSAGTQIVVRTKETGAMYERLWEEVQECKTHSDRTSFDAHRHYNSWWSYRVPFSVEGHDDVVDLKLLRPHQRASSSEELVYGTASGYLSFLHFDFAKQETYEQEFETEDRAIRSISVSSGPDPKIAATLGGKALAVYPIDRETYDVIKPSAELSPEVQGAYYGQIWSCSFIGEDRVAIGLGPTYAPIQVYELTPSGFSNQSLRAFNLDSKYYAGNRTEMTPRRSTSIYPIQPIPGSAQGGSSGSNVFLSGGWDGIIRLHDMRSPCGFETMFWDPTSDSSVYSLALQGLERVVAGVSRHSMIKVFDLRLSGSHAYQNIPLPSKPVHKAKKRDNQDLAFNSIVDETKGSASAVSDGWNLYLHPRSPPARGAYREDYWRNQNDSPVKALSIPSSTSPNLYIGTEGAIQSLTFHGIADPHPDPFLAQSVVKFPDAERVDVRASFNPKGDALNLGMYEQGNENSLGMQLLVQDGVAASVLRKDRVDTAARRGFDERWKDVREEGDRWATGQQVPRAPRRGHGRGRGRGGRGRAQA